MVRLGLVLGVLVLLVSPLLADTTYTVTAIENGNGTGPCVGGGTSTGNAPASVGLICGPFGGNITANAVSSQGHVGVSTLLAGAADTVAIATFSTMVTFSTVDPNAPQNPISVALNLAINGGFAITSPAQTDWIATAVIGGTQRVYTSNDADGVICINGCFRDMFFTSGGEIFHNQFSEEASGILTTPFVDGVALNTPIFISFSIRADSAGSVDSNFLSSLDFPTGMDVFTLPDGYTANATDVFMVNNRFIPPNGTVPEPASIILFAPGLACVMMAIRRRLAI